MREKKLHHTDLNRGGFTLLEVMLATAILSLVATMVYASFNGVLSSGKYVKSMTNLAHTNRFIIRSLTQDLASASIFPNNPQGIFLGRRGGDGKRMTAELFFTGFGRRFVLTGSGSDQAAITWFVVKSDKRETYTLMRGETPNIQELDFDREKARAFDVTDQLVSFDIRYLKGTEWKDSFDSKSRKSIPDAVRVEFTLKDEFGNVSDGKALIQVGGRS